MLLFYLSGNAEDFWPRHPEGAVARDVTNRLVGGPAALLHVQVEGTRADAKLQVRQPCGPDIDDARHHPRCDADKKDANPAGPGVVCALDQLPEAVLLLFHNISI